MVKRTPRDEIPLQSEMIFEPFDKWGTDVVGTIDAPSKKKKYIIMCINYLGKCTETKEIKATTEERVVESLRENVFHKFGYPRELVIDQGILPPT